MEACWLGRPGVASGERRSPDLESWGGGFQGAGDLAGISHILPVKQIRVVHCRLVGKASVPVCVWMCQGRAGQVGVCLLALLP